MSEKDFGNVPPGMASEGAEPRTASSPPKRRGPKCVNGVWIPETEEHMVPFLMDPREMVDGRGTYQRKKWTAAMAVVGEKKPLFRRAVDVGAHVGLWTVHLARRFERVNCFEPHPLHCECWRKNIEISGVGGKCELHEIALGDRPGQAYISSNLSSSGDTWVDPSASDDRRSPGAGVLRETVAVAVMELDRYEFNDVDFLKVDCEGFELAVLRGAEDTLHRCRPVVCVEQKHTFAERYGFGRKDACLFLEKMGAKCVREISGDYIYSF